MAFAHALKTLFERKGALLKMGLFTKRPLTMTTYTLSGYALVPNDAQETVQF
jgi:hypothetical protein